APFAPSETSSTSSLAPSSERTFSHRVYRFFKVVTVLMALLLVVAQVVSVVYLPFDAVELVIKFFLSSFAVVIILNELEWWSLLTNSPLLTNWVPRGYFYAFIGVVSLEENDLKPSKPLSALPVDYTAALFIEVSSWMMFANGAIYLLFGLCCGQRFMNNVRDNYSERLAERKRIFEQGLQSDTALSRQMVT
ncbi:hypothetical protein ACHAWF_004069, partial [Thalassiosira exigua]